MAGLVYALLTALLIPGLTGGDLSARFTQALRDEVAGAGRVSVAVVPAARGGLGQLESVRARIDRVQATDLPLAGLVPLPRPRTAKGRIGHLVLEAHEVWLDDLKASRVVFEATDLTWGLAAAARGELVITGYGDQHVAVTLADHDLDPYAASAIPELSSAAITFEGDELVVRARVPLIFAAFDCQIRGRLTIAEGRLVRLADATIDLGRIEISDDFRDDLLTRLDPLIDLEESLHFPVPLVWTEIATRDGQTDLTGHLVTPETPTVTPRFQPRWRYLRPTP